MYARANTSGLSAPLLSLALLVATGGCSRSHLSESFDGGLAPDACVPEQTAEIDLLLVVDNSSSMSAEQEALLREIPRIAESLSTGRLGGRSFPPIQSLQIGVVSTDMGTFEYTVPTCERGAQGDDGRLLYEPRAGGSGCRELYPRFLAFAPGGAQTIAELADDASCLAALGIDGCGFEQPLEAALKALSPASPSYPGVAAGYEPPLFYGRTVGHADGENRIGERRPFLRESSILALLLLTDEDDCSTADPELFNLESSTYAGIAPNLRCAEEAALHPPSRYIEGLLQLRRSPHRLVFGAIAGIPPDLSENAEGINYGRALSDPRMIPRPDETATRLVPACAAEVGEATPARRILQVAQGIEAGGAHVQVRSICQGDLRPAADAFTQALADALESDTCAP